jgi:NAD(P)-dependent dehydrogenase (short-subunit alcohol dehydrogenase family)
MRGRLDGKVALITGAASGIGASSARLMAYEGAAVVLTDIDAERGRAIAEEIGDRAVFVSHDVTDADQWQAAIAAAVERFDALHVLVNSAGIFATGNVEETELADWRRIHAVDLDAVFLGCKYAVPEIARHTASIGGSIINISSISGIVAGANIAAYNSAKAGVRLLTKSVALHCARKAYNIRCNSVHPTFVDTPLLDDIRVRMGDEAMHDRLARQIPLGRLGQVDEIAWAVVFLASDEASFMTGSELVIDGGLSAM